MTSHTSQDHDVVDTTRDVGAALDGQSPGGNQKRGRTMESRLRQDRLAWSGESLRMPAWLWLSLAAMAFATLHILIDFGVGLFDLHGRLSTPETATLVLISLVHVWWVVSIVAGAHRSGGGIASVAILGFEWTLMTNGYPIVYCSPTCTEAAPLSDVAHIGSLTLGGLAAAVAILTLLKGRIRIRWALPTGALLLVTATVMALSKAGPT